MNFQEAIGHLRGKRPDLAAVYDDRTIDEGNAAEAHFVATDGQTVFVNAESIASLEDDSAIHIAAFMAQMILDDHLANVGDRNHQYWHYAANNAVNARLAADGFTARPGFAAYEERFAGMDADAIYNVLMAERADDGGQPWMRLEGDEPVIEDAAHD